MAQNFFLKESAPTKVQVVNNPENPTKVEVENLPLSGNSLRTTLSGGTLGVINAFRPGSSSLYNVYLDNILLLQSDGTFVPIPLNSTLLNISNTNIDAMLASYKTAYSTLVSGVTAATLHYSKMASSGVTTSEVFNLKD